MSKTIAVADSLVPEEIFHAAQLATVRLSALVDARGGEGFFPSRSCTYCRAAERLATQRPRRFDGAVFANGCTAMETLFEVFARKSGLSLVMLLDAPKTDGERAIQFYARRLEQLAGTLAATYGTAVDHDALAEAIRLNNAFRAGLRRCGRHRAHELAGKALSLSSLPDQVRKLTEAEVNDRGDAPRLLIAGTHLREDVWCAAIEGEGGSASYFLTDDGDSYNQTTVIPSTASSSSSAASSSSSATLSSSSDGNLYHALARAYLSPRRAGLGRLPAVMTDRAALGAMVREHRIQGIVLTHYSFCAKAGYEGAWLNAGPVLPGTPVLRLELDGANAIDAQARTRIAAFVEMLRK